MRKLALIFAVAMFAAGCTPSDKNAVEAAKKSGLFNPQVSGSKFFSCGQNDRPVGKKVTGTNIQGDDVEVVVCCGFVLKSCTVRY